MFLLGLSAFAYGQHYSGNFVFEEKLVSQHGAFSKIYEITPIEGRSYIYLAQKNQDIALLVSSAEDVNELNQICRALKGPEYNYDKDSHHAQGLSFEYKVQSFSPDKRLFHSNMAAHLKRGGHLYRQITNGIFLTKIYCQLKPKVQRIVKKEEKTITIMAESDRAKRLKKNLKEDIHEKFGFKDFKFDQEMQVPNFTLDFVTHSDVLPAGARNYAVLRDKLDSIHDPDEKQQYIKSMYQSSTKQAVQEMKRHKIIDFIKYANRYGLKLEIIFEGNSTTPGFNRDNSHRMFLNGKEFETNYHELVLGRAKMTKRNLIAYLEHNKINREYLKFTSREGKKYEISCFAYIKVSSPKL